MRCLSSLDAQFLAAERRNFQTLPDAWDVLSDMRNELAELAELVTTERSSD